MTYIYEFFLIIKGVFMLLWKNSTLKNLTGTQKSSIIPLEITYSISS